MPIFVLAFLIGAVSGLRALTAPAVVSWAAHIGWLKLENTSLAFLGYTASPYIFTVMAIAELVSDKMPKTPSRKTAGPFGARIVLGGLSGAAVGAASGSLFVGLLAGAVGAVAGTLGGYAMRVKLSRAVGNDLPVALIEDAIAIGGAFLILTRVP